MMQQPFPPASSQLFRLKSGRQHRILAGLCALVLVAGSLTTTLIAQAEPTAKPPLRIIYLQPLGKMPRARVQLVQTALRAFFPYEVRRLKRIRLPKSAWYPPRRRWRADKLLDTLAARMPKGGFRILGITAKDISTTKGKHRDWGVLGLATLDGSACVISSFRVARGAKSRRQADDRFAKTAVHEIGHTLGLDHCPTVGCLMEDARGKVSTSDREVDLCPRCRAQLKRSGHGAKSPKKLPWRRPAAAK
ncbi:MAG: hypothetical protein KC502_17695 [Myxococcales bacterium]|nr:hypothetical protein [Myxococcales bacterium]